VVVLALAGVAGAAARAGSVLVVSGHGWGHGVGMSQWGAYGYARHGWSYRRILAHYYPGTKLVQMRDPRVRVLLAQRAKVATVGCAARMKVGDGRARWFRLPAGRYGIGPKLVLPLRRHHAGLSLGRVAVFACGRAPLELDGRAYHGELVVRSSGRSLSVVDNLPLEAYVRDVVPSEMPSRWSFAALEAQAVAARSYALAELKPTADYDLLPDTRDQVYGGVDAESPRTDRAVHATAREVLTWDGRVARTYYSSSSGGRTEPVQDAWAGAAPVPYLRSVPDPYDVYSPHHDWGPLVLSPVQVAARLGAGSAISSVRVHRYPSSRVSEVVARLSSGRTIRWSGERVARALRLRSTWFSIGQLSLSTSRTRVLYGRSVRLVARASGIDGAVLQRRRGEGWQTLRRVHGRVSLDVSPLRDTDLRLQAGRATTGVTVAVVPRLLVRPAGPKLLRGTLRPRPDSPVRVWRWMRGGWRVVARPRVARNGSFATQLRLRPGGYRITVAADGSLAATQRRLHVTRRMLASLRR
jgi:stage II sporulation protein D